MGCFTNWLEQVCISGFCVWPVGASVSLSLPWRLIPAHVREVAWPTFEVLVATVSLLSTSDARLLFKCLQFLRYLWPLGVWTMYDLGVWCLSTTVAWIHFLSPFTVTLLPTTLYYSVYCNRTSLFPISSEVAAWFLGLPVALEDDQPWLEGRLSICDPLEFEQETGLFHPKECFCSSTKHSRDLVLS